MLTGHYVLVYPTRCSRSSSWSLISLVTLSTILTIFSWSTSLTRLPWLACISLISLISFWSLVSLGSLRTWSSCVSFTPLAPKYKALSFIVFSTHPFLLHTIISRCSRSSRLSIVTRKPFVSFWSLWTSRSR